MTRPVLLSASLMFALSSASYAGVILENPGEDFRMPTVGGLQNFAVRVNQNAIRTGQWIGRGKSTAPVGRTLVAPAGDWTDLRFELDGPVQVQILTDAGATLDLTLDLGETWTVPLADPDATGALRLDLDLPAWIQDLEVDMTVAPGDLLHSRFAAAVRDSAVLVAR